MITAIAIAVAFARNPMNIASIGNDLNGYSEGRFILGLGSQVRAHIEKRFSMPWSKPASRMREMILALRAIWANWANWYDGEPLNSRGEWAEMGSLIDDRMLNTFAVVGEPDTIIPKIKERYAGLVDRITINFSYAPPEQRPDLVKELASSVL